MVLLYRNMPLTGPELRCPVVPAGTATLPVPGITGLDAKLTTGVVVPDATLIWSAVPDTTVTVPSPVPKVVQAPP